MYAVWYNISRNVTFQESFALHLQILSRLSSFGIGSIVLLVSRKSLKDKAWVTKGLKISIETNHRLYRSTLRETDPRHIIKYKTY